MLFLSLLLSCASDQDQNYEYVVEANVSQNESENSSENETQEPETPQPEETAEPESPQPTSEPEQNNNGTGVCSQQVEGTRTGDCAQNFSLKDKDLQTISLHDFYGDVIFLDLSAFT